MRRLIAAGLLLAAPAALSAPPSPAQIVKYRHAVMNGLGAHMAGLSMIVKGETDRTGDAVMHATAVKELSHTIGALFPEGTGPGHDFETEAKPEIWTQHDKFVEAVKALESASDKLVEAAKTGDAAQIKTALGGVGGACGDCHDVYKVDDHH